MMYSIIPHCGLFGFHICWSYLVSWIEGGNSIPRSNLQVFEVVFHSVVKGPLNNTPPPAARSKDKRINFEVNVQKKKKRNVISSSKQKQSFPPDPLQTRSITLILKRWTSSSSWVNVRRICVSIHRFPSSVPALNLKCKATHYLWIEPINHLVN